jgi:hypothetical protein
MDAATDSGVLAGPGLILLPAHDPTAARRLLDS